MIVYVYKGGLCDPQRNIGTCRKFSSSKDVDNYIALFVANIDIKYMRNYRILVTNDEVGFVEVDHYIAMNENMFAGQSLHKKIKEIDLLTVRRQVDTLLDKRMSVQEKRLREAAKKGGDA